MERFISVVPFLALGLTVSNAQWANVPINTNAYDQSEPAVAYSPLNSNHLVVVWNDFRDVASNIFSKPGFCFSTNNGNTWSGNLVTPEDYANGFDPSTGFDRYGYAYCCYVAQRSEDTPYLGRVYVSRSTNFGATWSHFPVSTDTILQDKPYMVIDNTGGARDGRIYVSWTDFVAGNRIKTAYSTDHGATWSTPCTLDDVDPYADASSVIMKPDTVLPPEPDAPFAQGSIPVVGPNGNVYVTWFQGDGNQELTGRVMVRKSTNGGVTFELADTAAEVEDYIWDPVLYVGTLRESSMPTIAVSSTNGYVYIAYNQFDPDGRNIRFTRSTDGGSTWSTPIVATDQTLDVEFFPWLTVAPSGTISLLYYADPDGDGYEVGAYVAHSYNNGTSFYTPDLAVGSTTSNAHLAKWYSDYVGIASSSRSDVFAAWADFRNSNADIFGARDGSPAQPQGLSVVNNGSPPNDHPKLTWNRNKESDLAPAPYKIWRKITGQEFFDWALIATVSDTSYVDSDIGISGKQKYTVYYKLKAVDSAGNQSAFSSEVSIGANGLLWKSGNLFASTDEAPGAYSLGQNFPNPFNPTTVIRYRLPEDGYVTITLHDMLGREVSALVDEWKNAGCYQLVVDATHLASGVYFYKMVAGSFASAKKLVVTR